MNGGTGDQIVSETTLGPYDDQIEPDIDMDDFDQINTLVEKIQGLNDRLLGRIG